MDYNVLQYIWEKQSVDAPSLQRQFDMSYKEAADIIRDMELRDALTFQGGTTYVVNRPEFLKLPCDGGPSFEHKIYEKDAFENIDEADFEFYKKALYYVLGKGTIGPSSIMKKFDVSPFKAIHALRWMENEGFIKILGGPEILLTRKDFVDRFGELPDYKDDKEDEAEAIREIMEKLNDIDIDEDDLDLDDDDELEIDEDEIDEYMERLRETRGDDLAVRDFTDKEFRETYKKILLYCISHNCNTVYEAYVSIGASYSLFFSALQWLVENGHISIEPNFVVHTDMDAFKKSFGDPTELRVPVSADCYDYRLEKLGSYSEEFLEKAKTALWYIIKNDRVSYCEITSVITHSFADTYEVMNFLYKIGYLFEDSIVCAADKFVRDFVSPCKYDEAIAELQPSKLSFDAVFTGDKLTPCLGQDKLYKVYQKLSNAFKLTTDEIDDWMFTFYDGSVSSFAFRLRTDGVRVYLAGCGDLVAKYGVDKTNALIARYDYISCVGDTLVAEFVDTNYAGVALLSLYSVLEKIRDRLDK